MNIPDQSNNPMEAMEWPLRKFAAPEFVFGQGARQLAGRYAHNLGIRKALVVSDPGVRAAGWCEEVCHSLRQEHIEIEIFSEVQANPRDLQVEQGAALFSQSRCDALVAVGGGSPMDCAKGIGIQATHHRSILEFEGVDRVDLPGPPMICIPTTAGSAADVSQFAIITHTAEQRKIAIVSKMIIPDVALIDPQTTTTMNAELTAHTGMDALVHAFEASVSNSSSPMTDLHAFEAVRLVASSLHAAVDRPLDLQARGRMMLGSTYAGLAFSNASLGIVHAMAHALGGLLDLQHGLCNALLLQAAVAFNFDAAPDRYAHLAALLQPELRGTSGPAARDALIQAIGDFAARAGIQPGLGRLGVTREAIPALVDKAYHDPCLATNPKPPTPDDLRHLYESLL